MVDLYNEIMSDPTTGYRVLDYFNDGKRMNFEIPIPYLGTIDKISAYMEKSLFHFRVRFIIVCLWLEHVKSEKL